MNQPKLTVSSSPHIHAKHSSTSQIMWLVTIALLPACAWGVYVFGLDALWVLLVSIASSVLIEYLLGLIDKRCTIWDGSAFLTGLLVGMNMPPAVPLFIPILASAFAIFVVKWTFGGLGTNWMNPALAGRVFVFFSFTSAMSSFSMPRTLQKAADAISQASASAVAHASQAATEVVADVVSAASPLSVVKSAITSGVGSGMDTMQILAQQKYPATEFAQKISEFFGDHVSPYTVDAFIGNVPGCIGEVSALLLIVGGIFLLCTKVITWHIPVTYIGSFSLFVWVFGGLRADMGFFSGDVGSALVSGGLMLGAIFMATDMVTSPTTHKGQLLFALGCGFFTFVFRYFGSLPEAVSLAILLMNIVSPTIERYIVPRKFGYVKKQKGAKA